MKSNAMPAGRQGFTVVELMVSMGILLILFALTTINLTRLPSSASQSSSYDRLVSDLRSQQTKSMTGYDSSPYGIHFENTSYTLFAGSDYTSDVSSYYVVALDPNLTFTDITFSNPQAVFEAGSGDIAGYLMGSDSVSITNTLTGEVKTLRLNKYGATE